MVMPFVVLPADGQADLADAADLFRAYAAALPVDLGYQGFEAELAGLPGKYAPPAGALLLARTPSGEAIGCVALRPIDATPRRLFPLPRQGSIPATATRPNAEGGMR